MFSSLNVSHIWILFGILLFVTSAILILRMVGLYDGDSNDKISETIIQDSTPLLFYNKLRNPPVSHNID